MVVRVPTASVQFIWCSWCSRCQVCVLLFHSSNNCWKKSGIHSPVYPPLFTRFQKHPGGDVWKSTVVSKCVLKKDRSHSVNLGVQNVCISLGFSTLLSKNRKQATSDLQGVVLLHTLGPPNHEKWRFWTPNIWVEGYGFLWYILFYFPGCPFFLDKSQETSSRTGVIFKFAETPKSISTTSALFTSGLSEKSYQPPTSRHWIQPKIFVDGRNPTQPPGM